MNAETQRLEEARQRTRHWKRWGPYLSERAWGTVREDYSPYGAAWDYFPHDHARSRALIVGTKTVSRESPIVIRAFVSQSRSGTAAILF